MRMRRKFTVKFRAWLGFKAAKEKSRLPGWVLYRGLFEVGLIAVFAQQGPKKGVGLINGVFQLGTEYSPIVCHLFPDLNSSILRLETRAFTSLWTTPTCLMLSLSLLYLLCTFVQDTTTRLLKARQAIWHRLIG